MRKIRIDVGSGYDVCLGAGLLDVIGEELAARFSARAVALVTDDNVDALHAGRVVRGLKAAGFTVHKFVFPHGEKSKTLAVFGELVDFLAARRLTKSDILLVLGGGIPGDLGGFAAATYLRGMVLVQAPTTLLAMVDSSVGGKTAVNLAAGKNLAGAFYQPSLVLADISCLDTLPPACVGDGMAETVKYGILADAGMFAELADGGFSARADDIIARCVEIKRDYVRADTFDEGKRQFLNLGHTIGHAVEKVSGFAVTHGHAVAIGTVGAARAAVARGICAPETLDRIIAVMRKNDLPVACPFPAGELLNAALNDKKRRGGTLTLVLPRAVGDCVLHPLPVEELSDFLRAALDA